MNSWRAVVLFADLYLALTCGAWILLRYLVWRLLRSGPFLEEETRALEAKAHLWGRVYPGLVWMALHFAEQKVNWLTHDVGDPLIGTPEYKVSAVRVEPVSTLQQSAVSSR